MDAASHVRSADQRPFDVAELFTNALDVGYPVMTFAAEMVIPESGIDDLGQEARASHTFLRYELGIRLDVDRNGIPVLRVEKEALSRLSKNQKDALFPFGPATEWINSVFHSTRNAPDFISTEQEAHGERLVLLHQDGGSRGKANKTVASRMPRTVLSRSNSSESPTVFLAKREMESWTQLQLEPSALRRPDEFTDPSYLDSNGNHLPGALQRLQQLPGVDASQVNAQVALRLSQLIEDIKELRVERDEVRKFVSIVATDWQGREYPAHALSDGTLRFLALSVMEADPETTGTICLEEPENGIHPARMPMMVSLLQIILEKTIQSLDSTLPVEGEIVDRRLLGLKRARSLRDRVRVALESYRTPDILFVHRDAERVAVSERVEEISGAVNSLASDQRWVPVVPVRMQEAWLLVDEAAIRAGSGNPNGRAKIDLPAPRDIEGIPDPKALLVDLLKDASGVQGRRRKKFPVNAAMQRVVNYLDSVAPLGQLSAFRTFKTDLGNALAEVRG